MSLYRKYRPKSFDQVIGQQHITRALINQIEGGRISHAYLFTGSRGTGKTTCAKIFARAVNCLNPVSGSPCGKCAVCKAGAADITELDAASNNSVDDVRAIIESTAYLPAAGKYKIYIIDEAHMLSGSAFNALLKTLEEPPSHVIFILATTEVYKIPATILSRCMRFDFKLIPTAKIAELIKEVYAAEKVKADDDALMMIAAAGDGSVRDALSIADRCIGISDIISGDDVAAVLGSGGKKAISKFISAIAGGDTKEVFRIIAELSDGGKSMSVIAKDTALYARDLLAVKAGAESSVADTAENIKRYALEAESYSVNTLGIIIKAFSEADRDLRYGLNPRIILENTSLSAARLLSADIGALEERVLRLEKAFTEGTLDIKQTGDKNSLDAPSSDLQSAAVPKKPMDAFAVWGRLTTYFRQNESMSLYTLAGGHNDVEIKDGKFIIWADSNNYLRFSDKETMDAITRGLKADGDNLELAVDKRQGGVDMDSEMEKVKKLIGSAKLNIKK